MKKILAIIVVIVGLLAVIDQTLLKRDFVDPESKVEKYERLANPETVPVGLKVDYRAPDFTLKDMNGKVVSLEDYKGKKILLNFWATWCPPCREEMPHMQELYEEYKNDGFVVLAVNMVNTEKNPVVVEDFVEEFQLSFPILLDEYGEVAYQYEVLSYPTSYFIDTDGIIRSKVIGALNKKYMYEEMIRLP
ncbi:peroxiredoxin family protein [Bacillus dakarensis]|uniref:peroxiredoxin family protein n=1 Tax=Robertmurraya dakarensis TaxID=1926278 RepID=UPI000980E1DD|nr:TlpA disulfide reductase family protein [Bacillus dakarensis]